nr:hypothetical protein [Cellulomonas endometrii]
MVQPSISDDGYTDRSLPLCSTQSSSGSITPSFAYCAIAAAPSHWIRSGAVSPANSVGSWFSWSS